MGKRYAKFAQSSTETCEIRTVRQLQSGDYAHMAQKKSKTEMRERLASWIKRWATASGKNDEQIADAIGMSRDQFNKLKNGKRNAIWHEVVTLAHFFAVDPPTNLSLETMVSVRQPMILRKSVANGIWREESQDMITPAVLHADIIPSTGFQDLQHFARRVDDGHADIFVPMGFYVVCVNYKEARTAPNHGDYVVVQRRRLDISSDGKSMAELSVRRLERHNKQWRLKGLCSTPGVVSDLDYAGDTESLTVLDLVVNRIGPLPTVM